MAKSTQSARPESSGSSGTLPEPSKKTDESSSRPSLGLDPATARIIDRLSKATAHDLMSLVHPFMQDMGIVDPSRWFSLNPTFLDKYRRTALTWEGDISTLFYREVRSLLARTVMSDEMLLRIYARDAFLRTFKKESDLKFEEPPVD